MSIMFRWGLKMENKDERIKILQKRMDKICKLMDVIEQTKNSYKVDFEKVSHKLDELKHDLKEYNNQMELASQCITKTTGVCENPNCTNFTCQMHYNFHVPAV